MRWWRCHWFDCLVLFIPYPKLTRINLLVIANCLIYLIVVLFWIIRGLSYGFCKVFFLLSPRMLQSVRRHSAIVLTVTINGMQEIHPVIHLLFKRSHKWLGMTVYRSHTTKHHIREDSYGRVISSSQRPLPDNTQHSQQTNVHVPGGPRWDSNPQSQ